MTYLVHSSFLGILGEYDNLNEAQDKLKSHIDEVRSTIYDGVENDLVISSDKRKMTIKSGNGCEESAYIVEMGRTVKYEVSFVRHPFRNRPVIVESTDPYEAIIKALLIDPLCDFRPISKMIESEITDYENDENFVYVDRTAYVPFNTESSSPDDERGYLYITGATVKELL